MVTLSMIWDPTYKPRLRPLEATMSPSGAEEIALFDRSGLSEMVLTVSEPVLRLIALMDGENTCSEILGKYQNSLPDSLGQSLEEQTLQTVLEHLEKANFLEGPGFEAYFQSCQQEYRQAGRRTMPHAEELGITDGSGDLFERMLATVDTYSPPALVRGLIAPHLDYPRGEPCYSAAYAAIQNRPTPDRVVILGTNHFGRSTSVVATGNDYSTPLGVTSVDAAFLSRLEDRCGSLRAFEYDHVREHSVELQVIWLQHLFGSDSFKIVPILCPDPCGPTGTAPFDGQGPDLGEFGVVLGEFIGADSEDTLIVAGADLSHVGSAFGDTRELDSAFLEEVRQQDRHLLDKLEVNDSVALLNCVGESDTRICSVGCIYTLAIALPDATATILRYHQAVDQSTQTCVTCAAALFV